MALPASGEISLSTISNAIYGYNKVNAQLYDMAGLSSIPNYGPIPINSFYSHQYINGSYGAISDAGTTTSSFIFRKKPLIRNYNGLTNSIIFTISFEINVGIEIARAGYGALYYGYDGTSWTEMARFFANTNNTGTRNTVAIAYNQTVYLAVKMFNAQGHSTILNVSATPANIIGSTLTNFTFFENVWGVALGPIGEIPV